jgi:predicted nucleic acid-binding protein
MARAFLDTNVLIYAFTDDPRASVAESMLARGCDISVQTLNEFTNVARRKLKMDWQEVSGALAAIRVLCRTVHPLDIATHENAVKLAEHYGFSIFDALLIASALMADCRIFYSEDMHHGLRVNDRLQISNPFRD